MYRRDKDEARKDCLCSLRKGSKSMSLRYTTKENKNELKKKERTKLF